MSVLLLSSSFIKYFSVGEASGAFDGTDRPPSLPLSLEDRPFLASFVPTRRQVTASSSRGQLRA